jgi:hypothetical protein
MRALRLSIVSRSEASRFWAAALFFTPASTVFFTVARAFVAVAFFAAAIVCLPSSTAQLQAPEVATSGA